MERDPLLVPFSAAQRLADTDDDPSEEHDFGADGGDGVAYTGGSGSPVRNVLLIVVLQTMLAFAFYALVATLAVFLHKRCVACARGWLQSQQGAAVKRRRGRRVAGGSAASLPMAWATH
jgi:hypothetical protein